METPVEPELTDLQLLKAATTELLKLAYNQLRKQDFSPENSVFGRAAPVLTLQGLGRLLISLSQAKDGNMPDAMITLCDADMTLMKTLAFHARQRHLQQNQLALPAATPESVP